MFDKVVIVGIGLLGASLARDLKAQSLAKRIIGVSRSNATAMSALELGIVDEIQALSEASVDADLIVLATPMQAMLPVLSELLPNLSSNSIVTDVGSVKLDLYQQIKTRHPHLLRQFVFAHPIAGGEASGVAASKLGLFNGKHIIITPTDEVSTEKTDVILKMWKQVGAHTVTMSLQQHDDVFAKTSHLPHVVAFSLVNYLGDQANSEQLFDLAAAGFYDFTRIASSNAEMWRDICATNQAQITQALDGYIEQLNRIKAYIESNQQDKILDYFKSAKCARDSGLSKKRITSQ